MRTSEPDRAIGIWFRCALRGYGHRMEIPKDKILELLRERGQPDKADQADQQLPDKVDPEQHGDLLGKLGIDPKELLGSLGGLGGVGKKLGL